MASQRVMKYMAGERERRRAEGMLQVCGDLIDLDISLLSLKIVKHVSHCFFVCIKRTCVHASRITGM